MRKILGLTAFQKYYPLIKHAGYNALSKKINASLSPVRDEILDLARRTVKDATISLSAFYA